MFPPKPLPSQQYLHECFTYNMHTGILHLKERPASHNMSSRSRAIWLGRVGNPVVSFVMTKAGPYYWVWLDGERYYCHRLIWKMLYNTEPQQIDHLDGCGLNNVPCNLADGKDNQHNRKLSSNNTSGFPGVSWNCNLGKWAAKITVNNKQVWLGSSDDILEVAELYEQAKHAYGFTERHGTRSVK